MTDIDARWAGRNVDKDRLRAQVWATLEREGVNVGPVASRIPNFTGADEAARRLSLLQAWRAAKVVKCNPDPPQIPVRLRALYDGKTVLTPVPELTEGFPFVRLDTARLSAAGVTYELAATSQGAVRHGEPVGFEEMEAIDLVVVGTVAATRPGGRTGKGGGFADLELGVFREVGTVGPATPVVTTVHSLQIVPDEAIPMLGHDSPLDWVVTEREAIETRTTFARPTGVDWDAVQADQLTGIPFLVELRNRLTARRSA